MKRRTQIFEIKIKILKFLTQNETVIQNAIYRRMNAYQVTTSRHLEVLEGLNLIKSKHVDRRRLYWLNVPKQDMADFIQKYEKFFGKVHYR